MRAIVIGIILIISFSGNTQGQDKIESSPSYGVVLYSSSNLQSVHEIRRILAKRGIEGEVIDSESNGVRQIQLISGPFFSKEVAQIEARRLRNGVVKNATVITIDDSISSQDFGQPIDKQIPIEVVAKGQNAVIDATERASSNVEEKPLEKKKSDRKTRFVVVLNSAQNISSAKAEQQELLRRGIESQILKLSNEQDLILIHGSFFDRGIASIEVDRLRTQYSIETVILSLDHYEIVETSKSDSLPTENEESVWDASYAIVLFKVKNLAEAADRRKELSSQGVESRAVHVEGDPESNICIINGPFYSKPLANLEMEILRKEFAKDSYIVTIDDSMVYLD